MSFAALVSAYRVKQIEFSSLKSITIAQWILESGRGTSLLAREHNNFGGLKWRDELESKVKNIYKVHYDEGRGEADKFYFGCKTEAAFLDLYWAFIERAPYAGWRDEAKKSPEAYLRHIVFAGYVGVSDAQREEYVKTVLSLIPEAEKLLEQSDAQPIQPQEPKEGDIMVYSLKGVKISFDCGHGYDADLFSLNSKDEKIYSFDPGATGNGAKEQTEVIIYANKAAELLRAAGATVNVYSYSNPEDKKYTLGQKGARANQDDIFVSCHLNSAAGGNAQGTEVLYTHTIYPQDKVLANHLLVGLEKSLGLYKRGVKLQELGVLYGVHSGNSKIKAACLVEPFFINYSGLGNAANVRALVNKVGSGLAEGILSYCVASGLAKKEGSPDTPVIQPSPGELVLEKYLRVVRVAGTDGDGMQKMQLQLCEMASPTVFRILDAVPVRSGLPGFQNFRVAGLSQADSHEPIPEGYYNLGPVEWANGRDNYNASWKTGIGATWTDCLPLMLTGRSSIGIHRDANVPGTEGCVGLLDIAVEQKYVAWRNKYDLKRLTVNYGLGTVETKLTLEGSTQPPKPVETKPVEEKPVETKPVPKEETLPSQPDTGSQNWFVKALEQVIDFIKSIISKLSGK